MKKLISSVVLLFTCGIWAGSVAAADAGVVNYLMADGASEPYQIISAAPDQVPHSGILTDLLNLALADTDKKIIAIVRPYKRIKLELLAQRHPQWISYGSPAWLDERLHALGEYSELPVLNSHYVLAGLLESGSPSLADVRARKVIVIHGYDYSATFYEWVESNKIQLVYAPSHKHALAMLRQYRGDFYMAEALRVGWQARRMGVSANELFIIDFSEVIPPSVVYFLFDKRISPAMRAHINQRLFEIKQSGELAKIVAQYQ